MPLIAAASALAAVLLVMYLATMIRTRKQKEMSAPLGVPPGTVRALLAILIVGGFVVFLFFGSEAVHGDTFDKVIAAFAALAGSATGFYFGSRASGTQEPPATKPPSSGGGVQPDAGGAGPENADSAGPAPGPQDD